MSCLETFKIAVDIVQGIVIILATLFTAWWAFRTFAYKEKIAELKELKKNIELLHWKMEIFCGQVRDSATPDNRELSEKIELAQINNNLMMLASLNLFTKLEFRNRVKNIVGRWVNNERLRSMQTRESAKISKEEKEEAWRDFDNEYREVINLIDKEAHRLI